MNINQFDRLLMPLPGDTALFLEDGRPVYGLGIDLASGNLTVYGPTKIPEEKKASDIPLEKRYSFGMLTEWQTGLLVSAFIRMYIETAKSVDVMPEYIATFGSEASEALFIGCIQMSASESLEKGKERHDEFQDFWDRVHRVSDAVIENLNKQINK